MAGQLTLTSAPCPPHGEGVEQADADLLAGSALALDQDGNIGLCDALQFISDRLHCGRLAEDNVERWQTECGGGFCIVDQGRFFLFEQSRSSAIPMM